MLPQPLIDALIIIGMFVLRIGVPLAIVLGIGAWLEKRLAPPAAEESRQRGEGAQIIPFSARRSAATLPKTTSEEERSKRANVK